MKKSSITVTASMLAVFASGAVVGALGHNLYTVRTVAARENAQHKDTPEEWRRKYMAELTNRLKLDHTQVVQVNTILDETRDQYRAVKDRVKPEMEAIHKHQVARVSELLSPQQKTDYDNFREERDRARKEAEKQKAGSPK
jgi:hypothetical protein